MNMSLSRKAAMLLAAVFASVALVACGGDDDSTTSESSSTPDTVTKEFLLALAGGDGEAACSYVSEEQLAAIEDAGGCAEVISSQVGDVTDEELQSVEDATYEVTEETDTTATVTATKPDGGATQEFELTLVDGEWKISGPNL